MKFSWKLINSFIDLKHIELNEFKNSLTLSGLEIEHLDNNTIDLSITANRKEISSELSLAKEISSIFNLPLKILPINIDSQLDNTCLNITRIIHLEKHSITQTPKWLSLEIIKHDIKEKNIIENIQEYIKIKWGSTFRIINFNTIQKNSEILSNIYIDQKITKAINKTNNSQFFTIIFDQDINNNKLNEFYENMYLDSIKLITTITKIKIGKYIQIENIVNRKNKTIKIKKNKINELLGILNNKHFKFITTNKIIKILKQLNLSPQYNKLEKSFIVKIPQYRHHDLYRDTDVIEEIGRIYKFHHFLTNINKYNLKGFQSQNFLQTQRIRTTLRTLGLHEVINNCLTNNIKNNNNKIIIYNPINQEQQDLRLNILENLLYNYKDNIKHSKNNIEIFEISKVFEQEKERYKETRKLGGLIYNKQYVRNNWTDQYKAINLFHFKNIIEILLKTINSTVIIKPILLKEKNSELKNLEHLFKYHNRMGIYNIKNNTLIGIIGELNKKIMNLNTNDNIYIFELNLNKLIKTCESHHHLNYVVQKYSNYPSVTRDISVKIKKFTQIENIINFIAKSNQSFIESINVINEYNNYAQEIISERSISLRITYRSKHKTLNKADLKSIDNNLHNTMKIIEQM